jgi:hypothetical protein
MCISRGEVQFMCIKYSIIRSTDFCNRPIEKFKG